MSEIKEKIHISLPIEKASFLRIISALAREEISDIVGISLDLLKHYLSSGASSDEFLSYIEQKEPNLVKKLIDLRNKVQERQVEVIEV